MFKNSDEVTSAMKDAQPLGTYFYSRNMEWNMLDRVFVDKSLTNGKGWNLDIQSFKIVTTEENRKDYVYESEGSYNNGTLIKGAPFRFRILEDGSTQGVSDHFPVLIKLKKN